MGIINIRMKVSISDMKKMHPSLNLFKDEYLVMPINSILLHDSRNAQHCMEKVFRDFWFDVNYRRPSTYIIKEYACYGPSIDITSARIADFIVAYEVRKRLCLKSIINVDSIGKLKAQAAMEALYILSDGKYDPEPDIRLMNKYDSKYKKLKSELDKITKETGSDSIKCDDILSIISKIYYGG